MTSLNSCLTAVLLVIPSVLAIPGPIDLAQSAMDRSKYPEVKGFFRIEADIIRMTNPRGTTWNFFPCDLIPGRCDPRISAVIDYETPNNDFGKDSVPYDRYVQLFEGKGLSDVDINKQIKKDVCGHSTRKVNVRVRALDVDLVSNDIIDHFNCFILTTDPPADSDANAKWSDEQTCVGHNGSHKISWKYRWYFVPEDQCKEISGSSGFIRRNIPFIGK